MEELSASQISRNLDTRLIGRRVIYHPRLVSTNDTAKIEARRGAPEGTVVVAGEQSAGKGRIKRGWSSPRGSISLSVILYPPLDYLPYLIMAASVSVWHAIEDTTGLKAGLKWPNDVLINGKKVCGILVETDVRAKKAAYAVIGVGINANFRPGDYPEIPDTATSLLAETGKEVSRLDLVRSLLRHFERLYLTLPSADAVFSEWRERLATLGQEVQVSSGKATLNGVAESVAEDGSLLLRHADGTSTRIVAGDITLRYPAKRP